ncbi:MAG: hypothetical protein HY446_00525 [Candidatus Niyogibacteria bacterium]|nr:hypothetical protein [Candidatus Niyogibacteria bacterium]
MYFIYGEDTFRARKLLKSMVGSLEAKNENALFFRFEPGVSSEEKLKDVFSGNNLFGNKFIVVLDCLSGEFGDLVAKNLNAMKESPNAYIILEEKPGAALVRQILKKADKSQKFEKLSEGDLRKWILGEAKARGLALAPEEISFLVSLGPELWAIDRALEMKELGGGLELNNFLYRPFGLVDLFAQKRGREAHAFFCQNLAEGVEAEEMFWKLWWQVKTLLAVAGYKESGLNSWQTAGKSGLKPFVVQKSFQALSVFSRKELEALWDRLFSMYRNSRLGETELEIEMERFLLGFSRASRQL